jgi:hypothetical protein
MGDLARSDPRSWMSNKIVAGSSAAASSATLRHEQGLERELSVKRLSAVLIAIAILVVAVGFYRGWFTVSRSAADAGSNTVNINLAADPDKMKQDAEMVKDKATELTGGVKDGVKADGQANDTVKLNDL